MIVLQLFKRRFSSIVGVVLFALMLIAYAAAEETPFSIPKMTVPRTDKKPLEYVDVGGKIPNYPPSDEWGTQDEPLTKMQLPLSPEESMKHFVTPVDFEVKLYASEPELGGKPIAMNWDERGRLWVCETLDYPNELNQTGKGRDRIRICEDTDRDGVADKFSVFADRLSIPTAITFYRGGAIVQNGVETLYLKDTDGDDKADVRKVLVSDWELGDTHGGVSNFRYGHDNWFWAMQGYNDSSPRLGEDGPQQQRFRMGFFRFKLDNQDPPNVTQLEFVRSTNNNTWGLGLTEEGIVTGSTANRNPSIYMPLANRYYERVRGWAPKQLTSIADNHFFDPVTDRVRQVDHHGGYTAGAGHAVYAARVYPKEYWNQTVFVCGPTGHLVGTFVLERTGADIKSHSPCNLLASTDEWSAPIAAEVGPDGNVWVLDWYNYIVQHNPTPRGFDRGKGNAYETDLRDKKHGRIYRVDYKGNEAAKKWSSLEKAKPLQLVEALRHPTMTWRLHAQRLIVEQADRMRTDKAVVRALMELAADDTVDEIGQNTAVVHAIWTLKGLGLLKPNDESIHWLFGAAIKHPSAGVRRAALRAFTLDETTIAGFFSETDSVLTDTDAQVRLAALQALADYPVPNDIALTAIQRALADDTITSDRWLHDALVSAASVHGQKVGWFVDGNGSATPDFVARLVDHAVRGKPDAATVERMIAGMVEARPELAEAAIRTMSERWESPHTINVTSSAETQIEKLYRRVSTSSKGALVRLARLWGTRSLEKFEQEVSLSLLANLEDVDAAPSERLDAATQLIGMQPTEEMAGKLLDQIGPQTSLDFATGVLSAAANASSPSVAKRIVDDMASFTPRIRESAINVLLSRPATTMALLDGVEKRQIMIADFPLDRRQSLTNHPDNEIQARWKQLIRDSGGLPSADRQKVIEEMLVVTQGRGDASIGRDVFKEQCAKCHVHGKIGVNIGPNLTGMSVHPKEELLVHILDPSRSVEGNYRRYTVVTTDGLVLNGMLASESKTAIEIIDTQAKRHEIARSDIEELTASSKSVMPEGFEKLINEPDFIDLLEFLTAKEKYVPLQLDKFVNAISTRDLLDGKEAGDHRVFFDDWSGETFRGVPFKLVDPLGKQVPNVILMYGPQGKLPPTMPKEVELPVNMSLKTLHMLGGVSVQGYPETKRREVALIVRLKYADGRTEDHQLRNGVHFASSSQRVDVAESEFVSMERGRQVRYLAIHPKRPDVVENVSFIKGDNDSTAPIIVGVTLESGK